MNATRVRVSACVDCGTDLIGEQLRCPACHDRHADRLVKEVIPEVPETDQREKQDYALLGAVVLGTVVFVMLVVIFAVRFA